jgi:multidrug efflux system membrane fusion protein
MKKFLLATGAFLLAVTGLVYWRQAERAGDPARAKHDEVVAVTIAPATRSDVPEWIDGIGTVQALNTVNIRPQIDGQLIDVRFREGQDVAAGDLLARIDPRSYQAAYDKAVAKLAQDQASLESARHDLARYQKLAKTQYTSAQQADQQASIVDELAAQTGSDRADIAAAKVNLDYTQIIAPFAGRLGVRNIDPGNIVHAADATQLTVLTTLKPINVVFTLPQQMLGDISTVMTQGAPEVIALPQNGGDGGVLDRGRVTVLDNQIDQNTGTIKLKAEFPNAGLRLWPGAFVNVRVKLRTDLNAITVPAVSVQRGPDGAFVYIVDDNDVATRRPVTVSHQDQDVAVITAGLKGDEEVVVEGAARVTAGRHVKRANTDE